jgi:riboflavin kinase/FMN adenylyltransferase
VSANSGSVVTIGSYDGVHRGHQRLIRGAKAEAERRGLRSVVVTFDRHPSVTVRPALVPRLITDLELKLELIDAIGVDEVVVLSFDQNRAQETPESFAEDLVTDLEAELVLVGENFHFGHDHRGDVSLLEHLGKKLGYVARGIALVTDEVSQVVVSSRHIRTLIADGALGDVARFLGRPFELRGTWTASEGGGIVTVPTELCWPPAGAYLASLRRPNEVAAGPPGAVVIDDQGRVEVASGTVPDGLVNGARVGLCFAEHG